MAKKVQLQTNGKEWQVIDGEQVLVDVEKQDIDPITSSSCVQIEGFRTLEEAVSDNKMLSQDLTYTKVMDKVGGDYHQNVLDGQYSKAILYGNTQVNLCEEDTSNALHIPTTFTSFNNGELQIKNKESQVVAPLIKGVTMVNLCQETSATIISGGATHVKNIKGDTLYTLCFNFTTKNSSAGIAIQSFLDTEYLEDSKKQINLGDKVLITFITHENANRIHICNGSAYGGETIQLDNIMVIEGDQTALDIPFFKGMKSVELVRPLTNLFTDDLQHYDANVTSTNNNGTVTVTALSNVSWASVHYNLTNLKANTNYLVMWDSITTTQTSTTSTDILICMVQASNNVNLGRIDNNNLNPTRRCIMFNTANISLTDIALRIHATLNNTETATTTVTGLRVFEYDDYLRSVDLQSIGWFSGTKNVAVESVKTCSKNLYPYGDVNFTSASADMWCDAKGNQYMYTDIASKSKARFLLRKGTYIFTFGTTSNIKAVALTDDKNEKTYYSGTPFVLTQDTYLSLVLKTVNANTSTTVTNIQIERGETVTDYVAHDSRYYEPDGQNAIVLRSLPDGVCDTFNLQTGEYTRRIGEIILDGDEQWILSTNFSSTYNSYYFVLNEAFRNDIKYANDKYQLLSGGEDLGKKIGIHMGSSQGKIAPFISSDKMTLSEFKEYLQQNPVTVQYELENPITTIIPRTIKRNNNGTVSTVDFGTYTNKESLALPKNPSYLTINSMTSIKPVVEPITYFDFKTRLKANTDYSVIMDKNSTGKTINLGGTSKTYTDKMLVRTPSIDLEQNLRISGSGSIQNIMVIEGDVLDKELPYFKGMKDVKMPIVKNIGKNLFDIQSIYQGLKNIAPDNVLLLNDNTLRIKSTSSWHHKDLGKPIKFKENTRYTLSFNAQDINNFGGLPDIVICFVYTDGTTNYSRNWGDNVHTSTAGKTIDYINFSFGHGDGRMAEFSNFMLVEGTEAQLYEPYKENSVYAAQGEIGLSQDMFEQGGFSGVVGNTYDNCKATNTSVRTRTKGLISVKPNSTYIINNTTTNLNHVFYFFDEKQTYLGQQTVVNIPSFITPNNCRYMSLMFSKGNNSNILVSDLNFDQFQLLELDSTVQLRSLPNGVKDELNLLTGEYIQRVGEKIIDGYEPLRVIPQVETGVYRYINDFITSAASTIATIPQTVVDNYISPDYNGFYYLTGDGISFIRHDMTLDEFYEYLKSNPITIQYELAEPIISYPRIVSNTQEREVGVKLPYGVGNTYNPSTGITTVRVGKVVLDGSEEYSLHNKSAQTTVWYTSNPLPNVMNFSANTSVVAEGINAPYPPKSLENQTQEVCYISSSGRFNFTLLNTKASTVNELKTYLASNPITVYYELKNPIVTTDIVLPNGVHDDYNPITGLYTKRVGFVELDGSDDEVWTARATDTENYKGFYVLLKNITPQPLPNSSTINNKFNIINDQIWTDLDREGSYIGGSAVGIIVAKSKLTTQDIDGLRLYLSQNPFKVWYELQTPITYQLTPYFGLPMPYAYKDGYLIMDSAYDGQTLPPEITYQLTVNRTGQITQNNIKLKEHTARLSNLEYILIEATLDSIFSREMQNFELELMNVKLFNLDE